MLSAINNLTARDLWHSYLPFWRFTSSRLYVLLVQNYKDQSWQGVRSVGSLWGGVWPCRLHPSALPTYVGKCVQNLLAVPGVLFAFVKVALLTSFRLLIFKSLNLLFLSNWSYHDSLFLCCSAAAWSATEVSSFFSLFLVEGWLWCGPYGRWHPSSMFQLRLTFLLAILSAFLQIPWPVFVLVCVAGQLQSSKPAQPFGPALNCGAVPCRLIRHCRWWLIKTPLYSAELQQLRNWEQLLSGCIVFLLLCVALNVQIGLKCSPRSQVSFIPK